MSRPKRRRATRAAAAAPNNRTIGGAGTSVPPVDVDVLPLDVEVELDVDDDVEDEVELDVDELVEVDPDVVLVVLIPPKLLDDEVVDTLPLDEVVDTVPDDVEEVLDTPLEVETLPLDVDTPLEVDVETPLDVETLPVDVETLPVDVEIWPDDVEVLVEAVKMALPLEPPKKPPLKKPPPKPPPKPPLLPPTMIGALPPPVTKPSLGGSGGIGIGAMPGYVIVRVVTVCAGCLTTQAVRATLRTRLARTRAAGRTLLTFGVRTLAFAFLTNTGREGGFSATCTAPPPMIAPPQVQAHNLAKAIRTDI
ncbi:hypothetical protein [Sphingosinicella sp. BN140058]|uniref:hypothetical protein n=1 Tax=Sphingosinicella sp. BN140058 TaxID=1892855 RepID=UPI001980FF00|nr:hypothetical protein [Sphingosinicella sp. BN140058]